VKCLGIDLGWTTGASGLCCLVLEGEKLHLQSLCTQPNLPALWAWLDAQIDANESAIAAVDAPTLIPNATGSRLCDRLTHKHFGRYHAGSYPANRSLNFATQTIGVGLSLEARGFVHAPAIAPQRPGRYQIEVFPHPATIHLFSLTQILKYKKGKLRDRKRELARLHHYIETLLPTFTPALVNSLPLPTDYTTLTGTQLKAIEDQLDSILCAYVAAHWWYWGEVKNWVLGNADTGYIIVPAPLTE
jgi:predicted RNase H-like nuclease